MNGLAVVIYGPGGSGKSHLAERLARAYECDEIIDEWDQSVDYPHPGFLHLTNVKIKNPDCYVIQESIENARLFLYEREISEIMHLTMEATRKAFALKRDFQDYYNKNGDGALLIKGYESIAPLFP